MSEWKPGDVAMVTGRWWWNRPHATERAIRDVECWTTGSRDVMDHEVSDVRPLVVIDPDSNVDTLRLAEAYCAANDGVAIGPVLAAKRIQAALREFARPTPRIEEPIGEGAVIRDRTGKTWVRIAGPEPERESKPWRRRGFTARDWERLTVVEVLTPGVES